MNPAILYGGGGFLVLCVIAAIAIPATRTAGPLVRPVPAVASPTPPPSAKPPSDPAAKESTGEVLLANTNRDEVLHRLTPMMKDGYDSLSEGSKLLVKWALLHTNKQIAGSDQSENYFAGAFFSQDRRGHLSVKKSETSVRDVKKDPESARGQRLCVWGRIISIHYERTALGNFNTGQMLTDSRDVIDYFAIEFSKSFERDIVERSRARLCGLFTELDDYPNSGGGTSHAIRLVGMFTEKPGKSDDD